jgi:type IX secretion system substrate protein
MKTSFTKKLLFSILLISSMICTSVLKAQMLEEIPNPSGYTLNYFSGGGNGDLFFDYIDFNFNSTLHHYDGIDLNEIPLPPGSLYPYYSHEFNGNHYIFAYDPSFNSQLFEFDGTTATLLALPAGLEFYFYVTTFNDNMYVALADASFNISLYQYDGTDFFEVPSPTGLLFNNYVAALNGEMYFSYYDPITFNTSFFAFDGSAMSPLPGVPANTTYIYLTYETEDYLYLGVQDASFNTNLYEFDGATFIEIPNPPNQLFSYVVGENQDAGELYISYYSNTTFISSLFIYDGSSLVQIPSPTGFDYPNLTNVFNGTTYISMYDNISFNATLFKLNTGILEQTTSPAGFTFSQYVDTLLGEAYYTYYDPSYNQILMKLDEGTNSVSEVPGPVGYTFSFEAATVNNKMFLVYYDASFQQSLWIFDGINFTQIENPPDKFFSYFMVEDLGKLYLRYDNVSDYTGTLYVLTPNSLPTSIDNSVTTNVNLPYFFNIDDFTFVDPDQNDVFTEIQITEIEQVGYLLWDGAHVYVGDIIPIDEIENMTYTPLTDGVGSPYDAFKFKVGDGEAFSELSYTMTINVVDPTGIKENELNAFAKVYPVPANTFTTLTIESEQALNELSIRIFSASGKLVQQRYYDGLRNSFQEDFDVSSLPTGNYFIVGNTPIGQLVKQVQVSR